MPVRDDIEAPLQHAIQRSGVVDQALTGFGIDQAFSQVVDGRVFKANEIAAAGLVVALRFPILALLAAWGVGLWEAADNHVEIP